MTKTYVNHIKTTRCLKNKRKTRVPPSRVLKEKVNIMKEYVKSFLYFLDFPYKLTFLHKTCVLNFLFFQRKIANLWSLNHLKGRERERVKGAE